MMKPEEIHFKWCVESGTRIYGVPVSDTNNGDYHIVVEENGIASIGSMVFNDKAIIKKNEKLIGNKKVITTEVTPSIWQQIRTLYKLIYEKHNNQTAGT